MNEQLHQEMCEISCKIKKSLGQYKDEFIKMKNEIQKLLTKNKDLEEKLEQERKEK